MQTYEHIGSVTISELLDFSLIYSDNIATNMLGHYLGGHASSRQMIYDLLNITYDSSKNYITAEIEYQILSYLYAHKDNVNFSHMLDILTKTDFEGRMDKYLPEGLSAHKIGTYDSYVHDVGIILDNNPYILVIYTKGVENADEVIAQISKAIYQYNSMIKS